MRPEKTIMHLDALKRSLYISLYQACVSSSVEHMEEICRRIHMIEIRMMSFRGGLQDR